MPRRVRSGWLKAVTRSGLLAKAEGVGRGCTHIEIPSSSMHCCIPVQAWNCEEDLRGVAAKFGTRIAGKVDAAPLPNCMGRTVLRGRGLIAKLQFGYSHELANEFLAEKVSTH